MIRSPQFLRHWPLGLALLVIATTLPMLGERPFRFEEGRRMAQVLGLLDGGSWWRLETFGQDYVNKPPMLPWLIALISTLTGKVDEWAARLPGALSVLGGTLLAGLAASRLAPERRDFAALAAGICFYSSHTVFIRSRLAETDALATFLVGAAFTLWLLRRMRGRLSVAVWMAIAMLLAAALLTKGPLPVLFVLLPMAAIAVLQRRWRELGSLFLALAASLGPTLFWLYLNRSGLEAGSLARELRLTGTPAIALAERLENFVIGLTGLLPALAFGLWWMVRCRPWQRRDWPQLALFLFAVPLTVLVLAWPHGLGRYVMPAVFPLAIMSGLLFAARWERRGTFVGLLALAVAISLVQAGYILRAGRTPDQIERRADAIALAEAFAALPPGPVLLVAPGRDYNRYVYIGRNARWATPEEAGRPPEGAVLLVERDGEWALSKGEGMESGE